MFGRTSLTTLKQFNCKHLDNNPKRLSFNNPKTSLSSRLYSSNKVIGVDENLKYFNCKYTQQIAWGDMDSFQHVNNVIYYRYFESARVYNMRLMSKKFPSFLSNKGVGPILASSYCRFKAPLTYPDTITVGARITNIKENEFTEEYRLVSHNSGRVAAEGTSVIVTIDYSTGKRVPIPEAILLYLEEDLKLYQAEHHQIPV